MLHNAWTDLLSKGVRFLSAPTPAAVLNALQEQPPRGSYRTATVEARQRSMASQADCDRLPACYPLKNSFLINTFLSHFSPLHKCFHGLGGRNYHCSVPLLCQHGTSKSFHSKQKAFLLFSSMSNTSSTGPWKRTAGNSIVELL